jgi:hypothetical protein
MDKLIKLDKADRSNSVYSKHGPEYSIGDDHRNVRSDGSG